MTCTRLAAALFLISAIPAAHAAAPKEIVVAYGDLDLGTTAGRSELKLRLEDAAAQLCSPALARAPDSEPSLRFHMELYQACIGRLRERAMAKVRIGRN
jgi:UrcA family protein